MTLALAILWCLFCLIIVGLMIDDILRSRRADRDANRFIAESRKRISNLGRPQSK